MFPRSARHSRESTLSPKTAITGCGWSAGFGERRRKEIGDRAGAGAGGWMMESFLCHPSELGPSLRKTKTKKEN